MSPRRLGDGIGGGSNLSRVASLESIEMYKEPAQGKGKIGSMQNLQVKQAADNLSVIHSEKDNSPMNGHNNRRFSVVKNNSSMPGSQVNLVNQAID